MSSLTNEYLMDACLYKCEAIYEPLYHACGGTGGCMFSYVPIPSVHAWCHPRREVIDNMKPNVDHKTEVYEKSIRLNMKPNRTARSLPPILHHILIYRTFAAGTII